MQKKKVLLAILLLALCCGPFLFLLLPTPAGVSLHFLKAQQVQDSVVISFAISNETHVWFNLVPVRLERLEGNVWKGFPQGDAGFIFSDSHLGPLTLSCTVHKVPGRLRLVAQYQVALNRLESFVFRARLRLRGDQHLSLSPFDKTLIICVDPVQVVSDEFEEP